MGKSTKPIEPAMCEKVVADFSVCRNYREVGRKHGISPNTVKRIVQKHPESAQLCAQKAQEHTRDALASLDSRNSRMVALVDKLLVAMDEKATKPDMFTNIKDLATAFGIVVDKMVKVQEIQQTQQQGANSGILADIVRAVKEID